MSRMLTAFVAAAVLAFGGSLVAQTSLQELAFDTNADLLRTPADIHVGEVGGVGANSKGQIFVYTRTGHPYATLGDNRTFTHGGSKLFLFDPNGVKKFEWAKRDGLPVESPGLTSGAGATAPTVSLASPLRSPECTKKVRVGENSPSLWPTMFSVTKTGINFLPLWTPIV